MRTPRGNNQEEAVDKLLEEIEQLKAENERLNERIKAMYTGDLSPESRLNGYSVIVKNQQKRIEQIQRDNNCYEKALATIVSMRRSKILQDIISVAEQALKEQGNGIQKRSTNKICAEPRKRRRR